MKDTKELAFFFIDLGNGLGKIMEDKKFEITELSEFVAPLISLPAALTGISNIPEEWKNKTEEQWNQLVADAKARFDIPQDKLETLIEEGVDLGTSIYKFACNVRAAFIGDKSA